MFNISQLGKYLLMGDVVRNSDRRANCSVSEVAFHVVDMHWCFHSHEEGAVNGKVRFSLEMI